VSASYDLVTVARTPQPSGPPALVEVGPIVAPTISWQDDHNRPGFLAFSCTTSKIVDDVKNRLLHLDTSPTEVWLYRNGVLVSAGFISTFQIQGPTLSVTAPGLLGYLSYMAVHADLTYTATDQALIAAGLVNQWQNLAYGHYGIDTSGITTTGVTRDRTYLAAEQHLVDRRLAELGAAANGFDHWVDPATRDLKLASPARGADLTDSVILDGRNITDANIAASVAAGDLASEAYGLGGDGETVVTSLASNTTLRSTWGRAAVMESFDGVTVQATLDQHTQALLEARDQALFLPGPGLHPVDGASVDDFGVGDTITYEFDAGLGVQSGAFRVAARMVSIDEDGAESMAVSFA
jgi:hypothetical protein